MLFYSKCIPHKYKEKNNHILCIVLLFVLFLLVLFFLIQDSAQIELLKELLDLLKDMVVMLLSLLEGSSHFSLYD